MDDSPLNVLLVEDNPGDATLLRETLTEDAGDAFRLVRAQDLAGALEVMSDQVIDAVVLDLNLPDSNGFETFEKMREAALQLPILVLTGIEDDQLGLRAIQRGAQDYLSKGDVTGSEIARSLRYAVERNRSRVREVGRVKELSRGKLAAFVGAKGGAGTSTVALSVAALLARNTQRSVTAIELRPDFGSLASLMREMPAHTLETLLRFDLATITDSVMDKCLLKSRFGFEVLYAPRTPAGLRTLDTDTVRQLLDRVSRRAAYTLVDLPGAAHPVTAAALEQLDYLVLVTERDPVSFAAATQAMRCFAESTSAKPRIGLVVVNRSLMMDGLAPKQIERALGCELLGVVPPAPEVSVSAQRAGTPLALHRPLSAPATMLTSITEKIARAVSEPAGDRPDREEVPA